ncbi:Protein CBG24393 [Caenorhabditis briggsae]|uniref:Protein CBG24393 n=1 Tax=Caenorhabditis briggsae TaxID=6238 RepID=H8WH32_CAEBR|nr:Protein CBG24393 [Caenorhabditis briggsae]CCG58670.1 Protein CBG24393 [Caenorhabditis briggsae]
MSKKNQKPKSKPPPTSQSKAPDGPPKFEISKESSGSSSSQNVSYDSSFIQIGNLKFSNLDLNNLVRKSGSNEKDLTDDPDFMKKLDAYASEQSQAIMDSTVKTLPSATELLEKFPVQLKITRLDEDVSHDVNLTKPSKSNDAATEVTRRDRIVHLTRHIEPQKPKRPVRIYKNRNKKVLLGKSTFVNPTGEDTPYFPEKADLDLKTFQESELESSKLRERKYPSLDTQKLYYKHPIGEFIK